MVPDSLINSLISSLIDAYTALRLSILSSLKAMLTHALFIFFFSPLFLSFFILPCLKLWCQAFFFLFFFFLGGNGAAISLYPWHNKILRYRDRKLSLLQAPTRKSLRLAAGSHLNIHGHRSVCKMPLLFFSFSFFLLKREDASLLNRLQMELNLEPVKGWMEGRLSKGRLVNLAGDGSSQTPPPTPNCITAPTSTALAWIGV